MRRVVPLTAVLLLTMVLPPPSVRAQSADDGLSIMRPEPYEPWLAPRYRSPPSLNPPRPTPLPAPVPVPRTEVPPPIVVPQTGRVLPNLPAVSGAGPGGRETPQDRAIRCQHQAGVYGEAAGDRNAYIGSCINQ